MCSFTLDHTPIVSHLTVGVVRRRDHTFEFTYTSGFNTR
jgi:hypothetical protein